MITLEQAKKLKIKPENFEKYRADLEIAAMRPSLQHPLQQSHFLCQVLHESGNLRVVTENMRYSADRLRVVFKKYFPNDETAELFAKKPRRIANHVYGARLGNRGQNTNDGWNYRGRGLIQLTGRSNYTQFEKWLNNEFGFAINVVANPNRVAEHDAVDAAVWFWEKRGLDRLAMADDIKKITKKVNGSTHSVKHRTELLNKIKEVVNFSGVTDFQKRTK